jgi:hypothetical protein
MLRFAAHVLSILLSLQISGVSLALADASDPTAQSSLLPSPAESGIPEKISKKEVRKIRREFAQLLDHERNTLRSEQSSKRRASKADRRKRKREWDVSEKDARRKFFAENLHGPERRAYVIDLIERRKVFYDELKKEERDERAEFDAEWKALKTAERARLNSVEESLKRSERPDPALLANRN